jgi:hypothetical protein
VADSPTPDPLCPDPVEEVAHQLENVKDSELFRKYTLWLIAKDEERGLAVRIRQASQMLPSMLTFADLDGSREDRHQVGRYSTC